jgi:glucokinase
VSVTIGVDIGGTKILAGAVSEDGQILATARRPTPRNDAENVLTSVAEVVAELADGSDVPIAGVGVGVAGLVDAARSRVYFAPNLGWTQVPVRTLLEASTSQPAKVYVAVFGAILLGLVAAALVTALDVFLTRNLPKENNA